MTESDFVDKQNKLIDASVERLNKKLQKEVEGYVQAATKLIDKLQVDEEGRIKNNSANRAILLEIQKLFKKFGEKANKVLTQEFKNERKLVEYQVENYIDQYAR